MMENNEYIVYRVSQKVLDGKLLVEISKKIVKLKGDLPCFFTAFSSFEILIFFFFFFKNNQYERRLEIKNLKHQLRNKVNQTAAVQ